MRDRLGLVPGDVEVVVDGSALRVESFAGDVLDEENGRLVIAASGAVLDDEAVRRLRDAGQR